MAQLAAHQHGKSRVRLGRVWRIEAGGGAGLVIVDQKAIIIRTADELVEREMSHGGSKTFLSIRMNSLPAAPMLGSDGYR